MIIGLYKLFTAFLSVYVFCCSGLVIQTCNFFLSYYNIAILSCDYQEDHLSCFIKINDISLVFEKIKLNDIISIDQLNIHTKSHEQTTLLPKFTKSNISTISLIMKIAGYFSFQINKIISSNGNIVVHNLCLLGNNLSCKTIQIGNFILHDTTGYITLNSVFFTFCDKVAKLYINETDIAIEITINNYKVQCNLADQDISYRLFIHDELIDSGHGYIDEFIKENELGNNQRILCFSCDNNQGYIMFIKQSAVIHFNIQNNKYRGQLFAILDTKNISLILDAKINSLRFELMIFTDYNQYYIKSKIDNIDINIPSLLQKQFGKSIPCTLHCETNGSFKNDFNGNACINIIGNKNITVSTKISYKVNTLNNIIVNGQTTVGHENGISFYYDLSICTNNNGVISADITCRATDCYNENITGLWTGNIILYDQIKNIFNKNSDITYIKMDKTLTNQSTHSLIDKKTSELREHPRYFVDINMCSDSNNVMCNLYINSYDNIYINLQCIYDDFRILAAYYSNNNNILGACIVNQIMHHETVNLVNIAINGSQYKNIFCKIDNLSCMGLLISCDISFVEKINDIHGYCFGSVMIRQKEIDHILRTAAYYAGQNITGVLQYGINDVNALDIKFKLINYYNLTGTLNINLSLNNMLKYTVSNVVLLNGTINGSCDITGTINKPLISGNVWTNDFSLFVHGANFSLKKGKINININKNIGTVKGFAIDGSSGYVVASGTIDIMKFWGNLVGVVKNCIVIDNDDMFIAASGKLQFVGELHDLHCSGKLTTNQLRYGSANKTIIGEQKIKIIDPRTIIPNNNDITLPFHTDVNVIIPYMEITGDIFESKWHGSLRIHAKHSNILLASGLVMLDSGYLSILGTKMNFENGAVCYNNDEIMVPSYFIKGRAVMPNLIAILVVDSEAQEQFSIYSIPAKSPQDILSYLIFSKFLHELTSLETIQVLNIVDYLSGRSANIAYLINKLGIDLMVSENSTAQKIIKLGVRLNKILYVGINGISDSMSSTSVLLRLYITQRFMAEVTANRSDRRDIQFIWTIY